MTHTHTHTGPWQRRVPPAECQDAGAARQKRGSPQGKPSPLHRCPASSLPPSLLSPLLHIFCPTPSPLIPPPLPPLIPPSLLFFPRQIHMFKSVHISLPHTPPLPLPRQDSHYPATSPPAACYLSFAPTTPEAGALNPVVTGFIPK